jgi:hypothetical protein
MHIDTASSCKQQEQLPASQEVFQPKLLLAVGSKHPAETSRAAVSIVTSCNLCGLFMCQLLVSHSFCWQNNARNLVLQQRPSLLASCL